MLTADHNKTNIHEIFNFFFKFYEPKKVVPEIDCENLDFATLHTVLNSTFKIENTLIKANITELMNIPLPAITFLNINGGCFAVISEVTENYVKWISPQYREQTNTQNLFAKIYSGLVLTHITQEVS